MMQDRRREDWQQALADQARTPAQGYQKQVSPSLLKPGLLLGDRYRVEHPIGRGGTAEVWRAHDRELDMPVALKVPHRDSYLDFKDLDALRREVRLVREIASDNVCRVFDFLRHGELGLISMEYIEGSTLAALLTRASPLSHPQARGIALQLLQGLSAVHRVGLMHCDIKPENVMLTAAGRVVLMDFSLSRALWDTRGIPSAATPAYRAPEVVPGRPWDARSDLFSVGVTLAEMVDPAGVRTPADRQRVWDGAHRTPPRVGATPWQNILQRTLDRDPRRRPGSARTLARSIASISG